MKATMSFKDKLIDYRNRYRTLRTKEAIEALGLTPPESLEDNANQPSPMGQSR